MGVISFWIVAASVIGIPELIATFDKGALRFSTISDMTGHLERQDNWVELIVIALVFFLFSTLRVTPPKALRWRVRGRITSPDDQITGTCA